MIMKTTGIVILVLGCLSTLGGIIGTIAGHQPNFAGVTFIVLGAFLISRANKKKEEADKVAKYLSKEENSSILAEKSILFSKVDNNKKHSTSSNLASYLDFRNYFKTDILKYESEHRRISKSLGYHYFTLFWFSF